MDRTDAGMKYWTQEVAIDPTDENTWYAGVWNTTAFTPGNPNPNTLGGLYKSGDRGQSWTRIYSGDSVQSVCFNPSPNHTNELYLCTRFAGLVYTSNLRDPNGPTFTQVAGLPFRQPTHVFFNPYNAAELWVTTYGNSLRMGIIPAGTLQFTASTFNTTEGQTATLSVSRLNGDNGAVSVNFASSDGTATAGSDYTSVSGQLSWSDGETTTKTFNLVTNLDQLVEGTETVNLMLTSPTNGATLGSPSFVILNIADSPMDVWRGAQFGAQANVPSIAGDLATPAGDGVTNLMKYALGLSPLLPAAPSSYMTVTMENGYLTLSINRAALPPDVTVSAQVCGSLTDAWQSNVTILSNTATLFKARDNVLSSTVTARFIRAVVTRP
jgi:hypothetical protein